MTTVSRIDPQVQRRIDRWLQSDYDEATRRQVRHLVNERPQEAIDAFYTTLSFGTGGLRGIVGVGTNRMNRYTVSMATQGLANYIQKQKIANPSVLIGYDSRIESPAFAKEAAQVLLANGIAVYLMRELRPVPLVSFGCRYYGCTSAIMITASHNPPFYNGYKVYWSDGGQVLPPHDQGIIREVQAIEELSQVRSGSLEGDNLHWVGKELDREYLEKMDQLALTPERNQQGGEALKVVYSNLHGTGITLVPPLLHRWGFTQVALVESQAVPDGRFPTVKSANPEEPAAMQLGSELLLQIEGDILLANDPDADRVGVGVRSGKRVVLLTGNQIGALCAEHICSTLKEKGRLPARGAMIKSLVTTPLIQAIAANYGIACIDVLPGFKYIGAQITAWEGNPQAPQFLFGAEESYGYLMGTSTRDKDGVSLTALLCEVALSAKQRGQTLLDQLEAIYRRYGVYRDQLVSISFPDTQEGRQEMRQAMERLRSHPPSSIGPLSVLSVEDYLLRDPKADILRFQLDKGTWAVVRPSGTEPKVKLYAGLLGGSDEELTALLGTLAKQVLI